MRKMLSLCLCVMIVIGTFCVPAMAADEIKSFDDVASTHWSYESIMICVEKGAITGTRTPDENGVGSYNPKGTVTLGQFLAVITRLVCPEAIMETAGHWALRNYIAAVQCGIIETDDFSSDADALNATISREDMAYILVGAAKANGEELKAIEGVEEYIPDYDTVSGSRKAVVLQCYSNGLITGYDKGYFGPKDTMTREQMATVVCRLMEYQPRSETNFGPQETVQTPVQNEDIGKYVVTDAVKTQGMLRSSYAKEIAPSLFKGTTFTKNENGDLVVNATCPTLPKVLADAGWRMSVTYNIEDKTGKSLGSGGLKLRSGETKSEVFEDLWYETVKVSDIGNITLTVCLGGGKGTTMTFLSKMSDQTAYRGNWYNSGIDSEVFKMDMSSIYAGLK